MGRCLHIFLACCLSAIPFMQASAQDPQFSQAFASPMYLNCALTGNIGQERLVLNHRRQWVGLPDAYNSFAASYDHNFKRERLGLGFSVVKDEAGAGGLQFTSVATSVAKELRFGRFSGMRFGLKLGYTNRSFNPDKMVFWNQLYGRGDVSSNEEFTVTSKNYFDTGTGLLYYSRRFWAGVNISHINRPDQSFLGLVTHLPMKVSLHMGAEISLNKHSRYYDRSLLYPVIQYKHQQDWDQIDIGCYWQKGRLRLGAWYRGLAIKKKEEPDYRNVDALVFLVGGQISHQLKLGYSYDVTISNLTMKSGGTHEISIIYEWPRKQVKNHMKRVVPCPIF